MLQLDDEQVLVHTHWRKWFVSLAVDHLLGNLELSRYRLIKPWKIDLKFDINLLFELVNWFIDFLKICLNFLFGSFSQISRKRVHSTSSTTVGIFGVVHVLKAHGEMIYFGLTSLLLVGTFHQSFGFFHSQIEVMFNTSTYTNRNCCDLCAIMKRIFFSLYFKAVDVTMCVVVCLYRFVYAYACMPNRWRLTSMVQWSKKKVRNLSDKIHWTKDTISQHALHVKCGRERFRREKEKKNKWKFMNNYKYLRNCTCLPTDLMHLRHHWWCEFYAILMLSTLFSTPQKKKKNSNLQTYLICYFVSRQLHICDR